MNVKAFKKRVRYHGGKFSDTTTAGLRWEVYNKLAKLSKYFEFPCNFNDYGCITNRFTKKQKKLFLDAYNGTKKDWYNYERENYYSRKVMCCCNGCLRTVGWNYKFNNNEEVLKKMARYYNDKTGFWRPDIGCSLPRQYRSPTCISYACRTNLVTPQKVWYVYKNMLHRNEKGMVAMWNTHFEDTCTTAEEVVAQVKKTIFKERRIDVQEKTNGK